MAGLNFMVIGAGIIVLGAKQVHKSWLVQALKHKVAHAHEIHSFMVSASSHLDQAKRFDIDEPGTTHSLKF